MVTIQSNSVISLVAYFVLEYEFKPWKIINFSSTFLYWDKFISSIVNSNDDVKDFISQKHKTSWIWVDEETMH